MKMKWWDLTHSLMSECCLWERKMDGGIANDEQLRADGAT